jgi:hypothetical protein
MTIINYAYSVVDKLGASLTDNVGLIIYNLHMFIVQVTGQLSLDLCSPQLKFYTKPELFASDRNP